MTSGVHHVTAMCGNPQRNVDFYAGTLGLRLIKVTVNYDDPGTYHLYYGNGLAEPGSALTFFPWPDEYRGRVGTGQVGVTSFSVPTGSLDFWLARLTDSGVDAMAGSRFDEQFLAFNDPDGMWVELVETESDPRTPWTEGGVPAHAAIRGFFGVTLWVEGYERTARLLTGRMGFEPGGESPQEPRARFVAVGGGPGSIVDIKCRPGHPHGRDGVGAVHHVAFRTQNDDTQETLRAALANDGLNVTPMRDRNYFHSIYFREPSGVLFEVATDGPGFAVDEPPPALGSQLCLPPWLEPWRDQLRERLAPFRTPLGVQFP